MRTYKIRKIPISKRSIKRTIKHVNYNINDSTNYNLNDRINARISYINKLLERAYKSYPHYSTNPKNGRRLNTIISKLHKELGKTRKNIKKIINHSSTGSAQLEQLRSNYDISKN